MSFFEIFGKKPSQAQVRPEIDPAVLNRIATINREIRKTGGNVAQDGVLAEGSIRTLIPKSYRR